MCETRDAKRLVGSAQRPTFTAHHQRLIARINRQTGDIAQIELRAGPGRETARTQRRILRAVCIEAREAERGVAAGGAFASDDQLLISREHRARRRNPTDVAVNVRSHKNRRFAVTRVGQVIVTRPVVGRARQ